tara:strand:+ start:19035 stop:19205 length:171 start_codon:yes stop_codon:yes gene_type:complete
MKQKNPILKANKTLSMSSKTKEKISVIANNIKGKEFFPEKIALAKKTLSNLKTLPI